jgi:hypothetical protein
MWWINKGIQESEGYGYSTTKPTGNQMVETTHITHMITYSGVKGKPK